MTPIILLGKDIRISNNNKETINLTSKINYQAMSKLEELKEKLINYYNTQVDEGAIKSFDDCDFPCIPVARLPHYLKSINIDWRQDFSCNKLTDLLLQLNCFDLYHKGVTAYFYYFSNDTTRENASSVINITSQTIEQEQQSIDSPKDYEIRNTYRKLLADQSLKNEAWIDEKKFLNEIKWSGDIEDFKKKYSFVQHNPNGHKIRVHNISYFEILDDIFFPKNKNYPDSLNKLRGMALKENWDGKKENGLLDNYFRYTYARIKDENKIAMSEDKLHACWNTGLVDFRYEPIYCYMTRCDSKNRWIIKDFCIRGENEGKKMASNIAHWPECATYFNNDNLLCQPTDDNFNTDREHIIKEHPSRLPSDWLEDALKEDSKRLSEETDDEYDKRIGKLLTIDSTRLNNLDLRLQQAIKESLKRCQWNYKTAIPFFDPIEKKIGWFLPLCIEQKVKTRHTPFAALVVKQYEKTKNFQGETIYKLSWAYQAARLVCRPDSDWLLPSNDIDDQETTLGDTEISNFPTENPVEEIKNNNEIEEQRLINLKPVGTIDLSKIEVSSKTKKYSKRLIEGIDYEGKIVMVGSYKKIESEIYPHLLKIEDKNTDFFEDEVVIFTAKSRPNERDANKPYWYATNVRLKEN